ncbi:hypothetical protein HDU96_001695, partial [Phlyctochytrium bullatum]
LAPSSPTNDAPTTSPPSPPPPLPPPPNPWSSVPAAIGDLAPPPPLRLGTATTDTPHLLDTLSLASARWDPDPDPSAPAAPPTVPPPVFRPTTSSAASTKPKPSPKPYNPDRYVNVSSDMLSSILSAQPASPSPNPNPPPTRGSPRATQTSPPAPHATASTQISPPPHAGATTQTTPPVVAPAVAIATQTTPPAATLPASSQTLIPTHAVETQTRVAGAAAVGATQTSPPAMGVATGVQTTMGGGELRGREVQTVEVGRGVRETQTEGGGGEGRGRGVQVGGGMGAVVGRETQTGGSVGRGVETQTQTGGGGGVGRGVETQTSPMAGRPGVEMGVAAVKPVSRLPKLPGRRVSGVPGVAGPTRREGVGVDAVGVSVQTEVVEERGKGGGAVQDGGWEAGKGEGMREEEEVRGRIVEKEVRGGGDQMVVVEKGHGMASTQEVEEDFLKQLTALDALQTRMQDLTSRFVRHQSLLASEQTDALQTQAMQQLRRFRQMQEEHARWQVEQVARVREGYEREMGRLVPVLKGAVERVAEVSKGWKTGGGGAGKPMGRSLDEVDARVRLKGMREEMGRFREAFGKAVREAERVGRVAGVEGEGEEWEKKREALFRSAEATLKEYEAVQARFAALLNDLPERRPVPPSRLPVVAPRNGAAGPAPAAAPARAGALVDEKGPVKDAPGKRTNEQAAVARPVSMPYVPKAYADGGAGDGRGGVEGVEEGAVGGGVASQGAAQASKAGGSTAQGVGAGAEGRVVDQLPPATQAAQDTARFPTQSELATPAKDESRGRDSEPRGPAMSSTTPPEVKRFSRAAEKYLQIAEATSPEKRRPPASVPSSPILRTVSRLDPGGTGFSYPRIATQLAELSRAKRELVHALERDLDSAVAGTPFRVVPEVREEGEVGEEEEDEMLADVLDEERIREVVARKVRKAVVTGVVGRAAAMEDVVGVVPVAMPVPPPIETGRREESPQRLLLEKRKADGAGVQKPKGPTLSQQVAGSKRPVPLPPKARDPVKVARSRLPGMSFGRPPAPPPPPPAPAPAQSQVGGQQSPKRPRVASPIRAVSPSRAGSPQRSAVGSPKRARVEGVEEDDDKPHAVRFFTVAPFPQQQAWGVAGPFGTQEQAPLPPPVSSPTRPPTVPVPFPRMEASMADGSVRPASPSRFRVARSPTRSPTRLRSPDRRGGRGPPSAFYNVRVAGHPVFLRRTSIRPPELRFLVEREAGLPVVVQGGGREEVVEEEEVRERPVPMVRLRQPPSRTPSPVRLDGKAVAGRTPRTPVSPAKAPTPQQLLVHSEGVQTHPMTHSQGVQASPARLAVPSTSALEQWRQGVGRRTAGVGTERRGGEGEGRRGVVEESAKEVKRSEGVADGRRKEVESASDISDLSIALGTPITFASSSRKKSALSRVNARQRNGGRRRAASPMDREEILEKIREQGFVLPPSNDELDMKMRIQEWIRSEVLARLLVKQQEEADVLRSKIAKDQAKEQAKPPDVREAERAYEEDLVAREKALADAEATEADDIVAQVVEAEVRTVAAAVAVEAAREREEAVMEASQDHANALIKSLVETEVSRVAVDVLREAREQREAREAEERRVREKEERERAEAEAKLRLEERDERLRTEIRTFFDQVKNMLELDRAERKAQAEKENLQRQISEAENRGRKEAELLLARRSEEDARRREEAEKKVAEAFSRVTELQREMDRGQLERDRERGQSTASLIELMGAIAVGRRQEDDLGEMERRLERERERFEKQMAKEMEERAKVLEAEKERERKALEEERQKVQAEKEKMEREKAEREKAEEERRRLENEAKERERAELERKKAMEVTKVEASVQAQDLSATDPPTLGSSESSSIGITTLSTMLSDGEIVTHFFSEGEIVTNLDDRPLFRLIRQLQPPTVPEEGDTSHDGEPLRTDDVAVAEPLRRVVQMPEPVAGTSARPVSGAKGKAPAEQVAEEPVSFDAKSGSGSGERSSGSKSGPSGGTTSSGEVSSLGELSKVEILAGMSDGEVSLGSPQRPAKTIQTKKERQKSPPKASTSAPASVPTVQSRAEKPKSDLAPILPQSPPKGTAKTTQDTPKLPAAQPLAQPQAPKSEFMQLPPQPLVQGEATAPEKIALGTTAKPNTDEATPRKPSPVMPTAEQKSDFTSSHEPAVETRAEQSASEALDPGSSSGEGSSGDGGVQSALNPSTPSGSSSVLSAVSSVESVGSLRKRLSLGPPARPITRHGRKPPPPADDDSSGENDDRSGRESRPGKIPDPRDVLGGDIGNELLADMPALAGFSSFEDDDEEEDENVENDYSRQYYPTRPRKRASIIALPELSPISSVSPKSGPSESPQTGSSGSGEDSSPSGPSKDGNHPPDTPTARLSQRPAPRGDSESASSRSYSGSGRGRRDGNGGGDGDGTGAGSDYSFSFDSMPVSSASVSGGGSKSPSRSRPGGSDPRSADMTGSGGGLSGSDPISDPYSGQSFSAASFSGQSQSGYESNPFLAPRREDREEPHTTILIGDEEEGATRFGSRLGRSSTLSSSLEGFFHAGGSGDVRGGGRGQEEEDEGDDVDVDRILAGIDRRSASFSLNLFGRSGTGSGELWDDLESGEEGGR